MTAGVTSARSRTLFVAGCNESVSSLYVSPNSGLIVVGSAHGAVRLIFPASDSSWGGDQVESEAFECVLLRAKSNEGIRTAYIDESSGRLVATAGDSTVFVWNLADLRKAVDGDEAACDVYAFNRTHSLSLCNNAYLLQHKLAVVLVFRNSVTAFTMRFPEHGWLEDEYSDQGDAGSSSAAADKTCNLTHTKSSLLTRVEPNQEESAITVPNNCHPCSFDGTNVTFIRSNTPGVYLIEVVDWSTQEKPVVQTITIKRSVFNWLTPTSIQSLGDFCLAVTGFNTVKVWSIQSGKLLYQLKGHNHLSRIVSARLIHPIIDSSKQDQASALKSNSPFIITLATDRQAFVWRDGSVVQKIALAPTKTNFHLGGPYFIEPTFSALVSDDSQIVWTLSRLIFNDDTGVHVAWT